MKSLNIKKMIRIVILFLAGMFLIACQQVNTLESGGQTISSSGNSSSDSSTLPGWTWVSIYEDNFNRPATLPGTIGMSFLTVDAISNNCSISNEELVAHAGFKSGLYTNIQYTNLIRFTGKYMMVHSNSFFSIQVGDTNLDWEVNMEVACTNVDFDLSPMAYQTATYDHLLGVWYAFEVTSLTNEVWLDIQRLTTGTHTLQMGNTKIFNNCIGEFELSAVDVIFDDIQIQAYLDVID